MSRPSRHGPKSQSQAHPFDRNGPNGTDAPTALGLNKARAQFNEPTVQLQAIFPDWKEEDLISVLEEVRGDVELAVARISEGHAEQWGAVTHKKDKKPTGNRERERERDGHGHHSSSRGASSPRGRGRGGARGGHHHAGAPRTPRDRATNGTFPAAASVPSADAAPESTSAADIAEDTPIAPKETTETKPETSVETLANNTSDDQKPQQVSVASAAATKSGGKLPASGRSWAQVAKPVTKPAPAPPSVQPKPVASQPSQPNVPLESVPPAPEPAREEPTTVEAPTWDDEPAAAASQQSTTQNAPEPHTTDGWVDTNAASIKSEESWTDLGAQPKSEPEQPSAAAAAAATPEPLPPTTQSVEVVAQEIPEPVAPQPQQPTPDTFSPPPGLANPALSSPIPPKPSTPSNSRAAFGAHRPNPRFKSDQAVILPSQAPQAAAGYTMKTLPLQFGSLNIAGDDAEPENVAPEQQPVTEQKSYSNNTTSASIPAPAPETLLPTQPSQSPAAVYRQQQQQQQQPQQQPQQPPQEELQVPVNAASLGGPAHTQAPSVNSALAMAPGPSASFVQHLPATSQHTLAGLTHTPQHSGPPGLGHSHHPSFSQQVTFPQQQQQQQYEGATPTVGGASFSGLGQSPQGQSQPFFRQTDSPFYNQSHTPVTEQHGFGGGSGGFNQGMQAGFNGNPGLSNDFGYDGQRNPYENYSSPNSFAGRAGLRQDDVKGLGGSPAQGLSAAHHSSAQPSPLGGQPSAGQGQGQYPGMGHIGNFYYNMNMNPYGYTNSFYPPTFPSFVNPMYPAGGQTPPHGGKPGMTASSGIGASGNNNTYSTNNSGHLQHASGGFDSDAGPNGTSAYHHPTSTLPNDFQKGPYATGGQGFLGSMSASGGVGTNRGPGNVNSVASGGVGASASPETAFKGYGAGAGADKSLPTQAGRGAPGVNQSAQQFYQNNRYGNVPQNQGYPQQQQQGDSYYPNYQRW